MSDQTTAQLSVRGLTKQFGATRALRGVDLDIAPGEIHALLGGNGSGKSTLIKTLAGVHRADEGEIGLGEDRYDVAEYRQRHAHDGGIRFVHQQGMSFQSVTVAENLIAADRWPKTPWGQIRWRAVRQQAREVLERFEIEARPEDTLARLRPVTQQMISIARALQPQGGAPVRVLVLDEPTATLPRAEVGVLHQAVRRYAASGCSVIYVTHRLDELEHFVDRATVIRDGLVVGRLGQEELTHDRLVDLIAGEAGARVVREHNRTTTTSSTRFSATAPPRLEVSGLVGGPVQDLDLQVRAGEIVGLTGLVGSGRSSVLKMVFGLHAPEQGEIKIDSVPHRARSGVPFADVAYIPEDRLHDASFASLSVLENLMAAATSRHWNGLWRRGRTERKDAQQLIKDFRIKAASPSAGYGTLSGGNQQKVILARWMSCNPKIILLDEPSQGVDVGARAEIHQLVRRAAEQGAAVLVASSDLEEVVALCDRAVVLSDGRVSATVAGADLTDKNLERLSYGARTQEPA